MMAGFIGFLSFRGIDVEENVERTESESPGYNRPKAQQGPPAKPVVPHEDKTPAEKKSHGGIKGSDVCFHVRFRFGLTIHPSRFFRCAFFGKSLPHFTVPEERPKMAAVLACPQREQPRWRGLVRRMAYASTGRQTGAINGRAMTKDFRGGMPDLKIASLRAAAFKPEIMRFPLDLGLSGLKQFDRAGLFYRGHLVPFHAHTLPDAAQNGCASLGRNQAYLGLSPNFPEKQAGFAKHHAHLALQFPRRK